MNHPIKHQANLETIVFALFVGLVLVCFLDYGDSTMRAAWVQSLVTVVALVVSFYVGFRQSAQEHSRGLKTTVYLDVTSWISERRSHLRRLETSSDDLPEPVFEHVRIIDKVRLVGSKDVIEACVSAERAYETSDEFMRVASTLDKELEAKVATAASLSSWGIHSVETGEPLFKDPEPIRAECQEKIDSIRMSSMTDFDDACRELRAAMQRDLGLPAEDES